MKLMCSGQKQNTCKSLKIRKDLVRVGSGSAMCLEQRMREGRRKRRMEKKVTVRLRRALVPCGGIKVSVILKSKEVPLSLSFRKSVW